MVISQCRILAYFTVAGRLLCDTYLCCRDLLILLQLEYNICFTTVERSSDDQSPNLPTSNVVGVLSTLLKSLVERRRMVKSWMKTASGLKVQQFDIQQQALKLTAKSMYGCLGFSNSRFYAKPLAELITLQGREILQSTVELVQNKLNLKVKNFVLLGDILKSIYFLSWKEQGAQLSLLAKDFGSLDCYATEFLIDGGTLSLVVSDDQKNIQIFYYAPKTLESWKGQKLLSRAEFHAGSHITKFFRLQMLPTTTESASTTQAPDKPQPTEKTNRFALIFSTLDGSIGCIAPLEELAFRRLHTLQKRLVHAVPHVCGLNPNSFRRFRSNGKVHRPGPENMVDCELLSHYKMMPLDEQMEIAAKNGTTRAQLLSHIHDLAVGISFL